MRNTISVTSLNVEHKMETISSRLTFGRKFILPLVIFLGFGIPMSCMWLDQMGSRNEDLMPLEEQLKVLAAWIFGTTYIFWSGINLKKVRMDSTHLYISNFRKEIVVPFVDIEDITEHHWFTPIPYSSIQFRAPTEFGQSIKFLLPLSVLPIYYFWGSHWVIEDLKERVVNAQRKFRSARSREIPPFW